MFHFGMFYSRYMEESLLLVFIIKKNRGRREFQGEPFKYIAGFQVLHGHFTSEELISTFEIPKNIARIFKAGK